MSREKHPMFQRMGIFKTIYYKESTPVLKFMDPTFKQ
jgi:hypothetical protein